MKSKTTRLKPTQSNSVKSEYRVVEIKFDKAEVPKFREVSGKNYIEFGVNNDYPRYLLSLYNESAKHGAIIKGKCNYIYGKGFSANGKINSNDETWNDILKKAIKDDELFRGFFLQIIWNRGQKINDIYHIDFTRVRVSKDLKTFFVKKDWKDTREKERIYPAFDINNRNGSQILYVREYNPFSEYYPLPVYYQGLNYIESDIEVSRHILGNAKKGFVASTLVNLNNGDPISEESKGEIEKALLKKFGGHEGQRTVIMFNKSKENSASIENLGNSILTKEDFTNINTLIQQEIFACHQITSPVLFGIKTDGQLGARNEIRDAYEIFSNTYVNERQQEMEKVFTKLTEFVGEKVDLKITPVEPLKYELSENVIVENLTKNEIREILGKPPIEEDEQTSVKASAKQMEIIQNDSIKNLTGRQYQNVMRIVRQFAKGKINDAQARLLLRNGYGLSDEDMDVFLCTEDDISNSQVKFFDEENDRLYNAFNECGDNIDNYTIVEEASYNETFSLEDWKSKNKFNDEYSIRYKYVWRSEIPRGQRDSATHPSRPFCAKMMELSDAGRTWDMVDIQGISERVGYSVFDRCGGWWTQPDGSRSPQCRHEWKMLIVVKRK